jgi:TonB-dependent receptor
VIRTGELIPEKDGGAEIDQVDVLPAVAVNFKKIEDVSVRLAYSQTIARPTFKELTPVNYMDVDPNQIFVGNQDLQISSLKNYDARVEWRPGGGRDMVALSVFYKTIQDPIQYTTYSDPNPGSEKQYVFPENYEDAWVKGLEIEARKSLDVIWDPLKDFSVGSNLTLQDSFVSYTEALKKSLDQAHVHSSGRVMDGQPEYLVNVNLVYQNDSSGFMSGLFYNFKGETYVSGEAAADGLYTPHVVEKPLGSLDFTLGMKFAQNWRVGFDVKNILDPVVETVYRRPNGDLPNSSYRSR